MRIFFSVIGILLIVVAAVIPLLLGSRSARAAMPKEGDEAPPVTAEMVIGDQVRPVKLADFRGRKVILYFYPKDDTPGCTREACAFRDGFARFQQAGLIVLGCSVQPAGSHKAFIKKYSLPFALLLDPDKKIARAYAAANGIPILGLDRRITYVIDEKGRIMRIYSQVDPALHAGQILKDLGVP